MLHVINNFFSFFSKPYPYSLLVGHRHEDDHDLGGDLDDDLGDLVDLVPGRQRLLHPRHHLLDGVQGTQTWIGHDLKASFLSYLKKTEKTRFEIKLKNIDKILS